VTQVLGPSSRTSARSRLIPKGDPAWTTGDGDVAGGRVVGIAACRAITAGSSGTGRGRASGAVGRPGPGRLGSRTGRVGAADATCSCDPSRRRGTGVRASTRRVARGLGNATGDGSAQPGSGVGSRSAVLLAAGSGASLGPGTVDTRVVPTPKGATRSLGIALGVGVLTVGREATDASAAVARSEGRLGATGGRMPVVVVVPAAGLEAGSDVGSPAGAAVARSARMALTSTLCLSTGAFVTETRPARKTTCKVRDATMGRPYDSFGRRRSPWARLSGE